MNKKTSLTIMLIVLVVIIGVLAGCTKEELSETTIASGPEYKNEVEKIAYIEEVKNTVTILPIIELPEGQEFARNASFEIFSQNSEKPYARVTDVKANEAYDVKAKFEVDTYNIMLSAPAILTDGTAFVLLEPVEFSFDGSGNKLELEIKLTAVAVEDMSIEELERVVNTLEATGNIEAAKALSQRKTAPSADSITPDNPANTNDGTNNTNTGSNSNRPTINNNSGNRGGNSNSGGSTTAPKPTPTPVPVPQEPQKVWHDPVTEQVWVVDQPGYNKSEPVYADRAICNNCGADITADPNHQSTYESFERGCQSYSVIKVQVGTNDTWIPEKGHHETKVVKEGGWW